MRLVGGTGSPEEPRLPPGYVLDRSDPDVLLLLCPDGEAVARFSGRGHRTGGEDAPQGAQPDRVRQGYRALPTPSTPRRGQGVPVPPGQVCAGELVRAMPAT
jgi:hypothetical protein